MGKSWNRSFDCSSSIAADAVSTGVAVIAHTRNIVGYNPFPGASKYQTVICKGSMLAVKKTIMSDTLVGCVAHEATRSAEVLNKRMHQSQLDGGRSASTKNARTEVKQQHQKIIPVSVFRSSKEEGRARLIQLTCM